MTERPRGAKEFQRLLQRHAAEVGQLPQRVMHLVRVGVVCAMLDEVRHPDGGHLFIVKGGTEMQLRLGIRARARTDLDVVFAGQVEEWLARFDAATADRTHVPNRYPTETTGYVMSSTSGFSKRCSSPPTWGQFGTRAWKSSGDGNATRGLRPFTNLRPGPLTTDCSSPSIPTRLRRWTMRSSTSLGLLTGSTLQREYRRAIGRGSYATDRCMQPAVNAMDLTNDPGGRTCLRGVSALAATMGDAACWLRLPWQARSAALVASGCANWGSGVGKRNDSRGDPGEMS